MENYESFRLLILGKDTTFIVLPKAVEITTLFLYSVGLS